MRAGLSTIQQTLTAEASAVLNRAIADAARRRHGQTTPLHVAAALLSSSSGHLRQACLRSHPNPSSSHPLQCRALELCFSVALDRLPPSSSSSPSTAATAADDSPPPPPPPPPPPLSNALMAALKRAQAHQRRGCPESQQQPLLAVKVELDHLLLSILDDPSVSRVMREASFSSPAVKASIENTLSSSSSSPSPSPARNLYLNPRLVGAAPSPSPAAAGTDLAKVFDILTRGKKRNPILVGDADPGAVLREAIQKMEASDAPLPVRSVAVISTEKEFSFSSLDRTQIPSRIRELAIMVEARIAGGAATGVVLDLGDLKWLVDGGSQQQGVTDIGRTSVAEMGRLLLRFCADGGSRVWLVGTATCATYLRCQVYFPTMESDWDLQALPIAPRSPPLPGLFPRLESNGIASSRIEALGTPRGFPAISVSGMTPRRPSENLVTFSKNSLCNICTESYERELAKLGEGESEKPSSSDDQQEAGKSLPHWLQFAAMPSTKLQRQEQELVQKWKDTCSHLHRTSLLVAIKPPVTGFPAMARGPINRTSPKLAVQSSSNNLGTVLNMPERPQSPPKCPVKTDLALGPLQKPPKEPAPTKFTGDATSIKRLVNGLLDKVSWQAEAASTVAAAIIQSKSGGGKRRGGSQKADTWLLFAGLDWVGKQKMTIALSELMFDTPPLIIRHGLASADASEGVKESNMSFRGRTSIDRVAETLRLNPFSTIFFEDLDRTDLTVRGTIRKAMERGRLVDSHGREVGLGSAIFILTTSWIPEEIGSSNEEVRRSEERIMELATSGRQLELQLEERRNKRGPDWLFKDGRLNKLRKDSLSLDLNLSTGATVVADSSGNEDAAEGSWNSSDLTVEEQDHGQGHLFMERRALPPVASSGVSELIELVDATIVFKPVDFQPLRNRVSASVSTKFTEIMGEGASISIDGDALNQMAGGVWLGGGCDAANLFDEWTDQVFAPAVKQLRGNPKVEDGAIVRLSSVKNGGQMQRSCLPALVKVPVRGR